MKLSTAVSNINVMRYMGNKRPILPHITSLIESYSRPGETVIDLMAGTHSVGYSTCQRNRVIANDVGCYSLPIGRALLKRPNGFNPDQYVRLIAEAASENRSDGIYTFFQKNYADTYFSLRQCIEIDDLRYAVEVLDHYDRYAADLAMAALISAMCYAQSTPGHFAQFMPSDHSRVQPLRAISIIESFTERFRFWAIDPASHDHEILNEDWRVIFAAGFAEDAKVVYVDPPYNTEQYSRFYHVLETVVRYDNPELNHKAKYREDRFKSKFSYKRTVEEEFEELFATCRKACDATILLSYSSTGIVSPEQLEHICCPNYRMASCKEIDHPHSTQGKGRKTDVKELLFTFEPVQ